MSYLNVEIKAKSNHHEKLREILQWNWADFKWADHQIDTYFQVNSGRLKLREWIIENHLIHYERHNQEWPKQSHVTLFSSDPKSSLKDILTKSLGILVVVDKQREIYFIDNVKFHIDTVANLGTFMEIEAIDNDGSIGLNKLQEQCNYYMKLLNISEEDLISVSYSDLLLQNS
jgi:adenylate cyclase class 2